MGFGLFAGGHLVKWALAVLPGILPLEGQPVAIAPNPIAAVNLRLQSFVDITPRAVLSHGEIRRSPDGLFYINARVNGAPVRFLVDTGASAIVLTKADAARAGILPDARAFSESADTAGGRTSMARIKLAHLTAGATERREVDAVIASEGLGVSLLGQSWLSRLASLQIEGDRMVMR